MEVVHRKNGFRRCPQEKWFSTSPIKMVICIPGKVIGMFIVPVSLLGLLPLVLVDTCAGLVAFGLLPLAV